MFPNASKSRIADLICAALSLTRSFLLLEDDDSVDWEVDQDEWVESEHPRRAAYLRQAEPLHQADHPHREPLRGRPSFARRAGQPPSPAQVCLCPVGSPSRAPAGRGSRCERAATAVSEAAPAPGKRGATPSLDKPSGAPSLDKRSGTPNRRAVVGAAPTE